MEDPTHKTIEAQIAHMVNPGEPWKETFTIPAAADPQGWINDTVCKFNATLREGERARMCVSFKVVGTERRHRWVKMTAGQSVQFRGSTVDLHTCQDCGITGKRYGLSPVIKRDSKYRAKRYEFCTGQREEL